MATSMRTIAVAAVPPTVIQQPLMAIPNDPKFVSKGEQKKEKQLENSPREIYRRNIQNLYKAIEDLKAHLFQAKCSQMRLERAGRTYSCLGSAINIETETAVPAHIEPATDILAEQSRFIQHITDAADAAANYHAAKRAAEEAKKILRQQEPNSGRKDREKEKELDNQLVAESINRMVEQARYLGQQLNAEAIIYRINSRCCIIL